MEDDDLCVSDVNLIQNLMENVFGFCACFLVCFLLFFHQIWVSMS
jgi:hypothetical protein